MSTAFTRENLKNRQSFGLAFLLISFFVFLILDIATGSVNIPCQKLISAFIGGAPDDIYHQIIWDFRLPKAFTCILAGAGLAAGGLMMQTFFRNPLAGPDVLGLSSGASLMVAITILIQGMLPFGLGSFRVWGVALAAAMGAMGVFVLVVIASRKVKENSSLLIIGMMVAAFTSSLVSVLQFLSKADELQAFLIWSLGSVGGTNWNEIGVMAIIIGIGLLIALNSIKSLNSWFLGEGYATSIGVNVKRARVWIVLSASLMVGTITAFCGPIAFVGLAVPHLVKLLFPHSNHKILLPAVALGGAILLLLCDTISQLPGSTQILPLNAITSFIGAPVLIWVVIRSKQRN
jgi:iron complex transport system permease protein